MTIPLLHRGATYALLLCFAACTTGSDGARSVTTGTAGVIAKVGPYPVTTADLEQAVGSIFGGGATPGELDEADLRITVDALIGARVLVLAAERRGIDRDPVIVAALDSLRDVRLREVIYEQDVYGDLPVVSAQDLDKLYAEWGSGEQVRAAHILTRSREEAADIARLLSEGADFAQLARERSQHTASSTQGGAMGFLRRSQYPRAIADVIWDLPVGEYSEPVRTFMGWHVVTVTARRRLASEEQRIALETEFDMRQRQLAKTRFVAQLRGSYEVIYYPETATAVASLVDTISGQRLLFSWRDGSLDLAGFLQRVQVPDPVSADTARMHRLAAELVFDELAAREAQARGYLSHSEVHNSVRDKRLRLLGEAMFAAEMTPEPRLGEVRAFFDKHKEQFRSHTVVTIREILVDLPTLADSLYQLAAAGRSLEELAREHTVRTDLKKTGGFWADVRPQDPRSGRIYAAAMLQGPGLHPPMKVNGGYSVFDVLEIRPGEILAFADAESSARQALGGVRMEALMKRLRQEFADQISLDVKALGTPVPGAPESESR